MFATILNPEQGARILAGMFFYCTDGAGNASCSVEHFESFEAERGKGTNYWLNQAKAGDPTYMYVLAQQARLSLIHEKLVGSCVS